MKKEVKIQLFEKMLEFEHRIGEPCYAPGVDYFERCNGAFEMLKILGLTSEYIEWSYGK